MRQAKLADPHGRASNKALQHILRLEGEAQNAALNLDPKVTLKTEFPTHAFGQQAKPRCRSSLPRWRRGRFAWDSVRLTPIRASRAPSRLCSNSLLKASMPYAKPAWSWVAGRTPPSSPTASSGAARRENQSNGTDHGTANTQFVIGGGVKGGLYGSHPSLTQLSGDGNLIFTTDYRALYGTLLTQWWGLVPRRARGARRQIRAATAIRVIAPPLYGIRIAGRGVVNYWARSPSASGSDSDNA